MITPMKKITLFVTSRDRESFVADLRALGVVHIKNIRQPQANEIDVLEDEISRVKKAISVLASYKDGGSTISPSEHKTDLLKEADAIGQAWENKCDTTEDLADLQAKLNWYKPWGGFNPSDIENFKKYNIFIRLYNIGLKEFKALENKSNLKAIKQTIDRVYVIAVFQDRESALPFEELTLPKENYDDILEDVIALKTKTEEMDSFLKTKLRLEAQLKKHLKPLENKDNFLRVMFGMKEEDKFYYLSGFCPADQVAGLISLSKAKNAAYAIEDPAEGEDVPTLIRNPKWIKIIEPVFKFMNTIPGYREHDISALFLLFFTLFFAIIIGDAGYGILFFAATFYLRKKIKNAPKEIFQLLYVLSTATIIWGAMTGSWFGVEKIANLPFMHALQIEKFDSTIAENRNFIMFFCFCIGVVHLTLAHIVLWFKTMNSPKSISQIGWVLILWASFFLAGQMVIGITFPAFAKYLFCAGLFLVVIFSNFQKNLLKGILVTLIDLPFKIIGCFSDIISYLRLFAISYASVVIVGIFNEFTGTIGFDSFLRGLLCAAILFFGHALNIVLSILAVVVHGVRLNMLEFAGHLNMEWSGREYIPFKE